ncbi:ArsR/SmtB family transcription factor [Kordiimonas aestuarii]|uniref:ArsR/SmtB family transcription factor n=1 Tax=Kordiimonas aestuarii TaxID=1005925 RepID=UPI0021D0F135|nr:metalloregulator ArsR/SmtB family transcription factor [Kordiimonas aestuarii]
MVDYLTFPAIFNYMVKYNTDRLDATFHALADPTRRGMLASLMNGEKTVSALAQPYAMSLAAASKHIRKLEVAGLVDRKVEGRTHYCRLNAANMAEAHAWMERYRRFWEGKLDLLGALLDAEDKADKTS